MQAQPQDTISLSNVGLYAETQDESVSAGQSSDPPVSNSDLQVIHNRVVQELSTIFIAKGSAANAAELPSPATADRVAAAEKATAFVRGLSSSNPFKGLPRNQLTAIIYDESGRYTLNERQAALGQQQNNDSAYITTASNLSDATGDNRYLASALYQLSQHLSPVEAAVPDNVRLLTTPTEQLIAQLNAANAANGGPLLSDLPYPGNWANA